MNIHGLEWKTLVEVIYGTWVSPTSNNIMYLKPLTTEARFQMAELATQNERRMCFIHLLIDMYNAILKKTSADEARTKVTMLLWALQMSVQE